MEAEKRNPWTTLASRVVYENPWITVREDNVLRPDGKPGIYGVVETRVATGVVALTDDNQVYMVGQYRYPIDQYSWEIIEGGANVGEEPLAAIKRELREEAGVVAEHWRELGSVVHLSNCFSAEEARLFVARGVREIGAEPDGTEKLEVRKLPFSEVLRMVQRGEITDSMTVIAIYRAEELLRRGEL